MTTLCLCPCSGLYYKHSWKLKPIIDFKLHSNPFSYWRIIVGKLKNTKVLMYKYVMSNYRSSTNIFYNLHSYIIYNRVFKMIWTNWNAVVLSSHGMIFPVLYRISFLNAVGGSNFMNSLFTSVNCFLTSRLLYFSDILSYSWKKVEM